GVRLSRAARFIRPPHNALAPANAHPDQPARRGPNTTEKTEAIATYSAGVTPLAMPTHVLWLPRCPVGWHQRGLGPIGPPGPTLLARMRRPPAGPGRVRPAAGGGRGRAGWERGYRRSRTPTRVTAATAAVTKIVEMSGPVPVCQPNGPAGCQYQVLASVASSTPKSGSARVPVTAPSTLARLGHRGESSSITMPTAKPSSARTKLTGASSTLPSVSITAATSSR